MHREEMKRDLLEHVIVGSEELQHHTARKLWNI